MVKKFTGSPAYSGVPNSDIVLPDGDYASPAVASLVNTDYNAVLAALKRTDIPRIVQFSAGNWALYFATDVSYAAETQTYTISYPAVAADTSATIVTLQKIGEEVTAGFEAIGNGWEVEIVEVPAA